MLRQVKLSLVNQAVEGGIKNKLMVDKGLETPLHFVEKNTDPNYCWNEWELRKKSHTNGQHPQRPKPEATRPFSQTSEWTQTHRPISKSTPKQILSRMREHNIRRRRNQSVYDQ